MQSALQPGGSTFRAHGQPFCEERIELRDCRRHVLFLVVQADVGSSFNPEHFLGFARGNEGIARHPRRIRFRPDDHEERARRDGVYEADSVKRSQAIHAGPGERQGPVIPAARSAIVLPLLEQMTSASVCLRFVGREERKSTNAFSTGLRCPGSGGSVEYGLENRGRLRPIGAVSSGTFPRGFGSAHRYRQIAASLGENWDR
jgi:hypothetical protein